MNDYVISFRQAIESHGLQPGDIEPGRLHRFPGANKSGSNRAAWAKMFEDGRGGVFGDYSTGLSESWQAEFEKPITPAEREAFRRNVTEARKQAERKRQAEQAEAAKKAAAIWQASSQAPTDHPYLKSKNVQAHGLRLHDEALVIPLRDGSGAICSLQFVTPDGGKRFLTNGKKKGCYFAIGCKPERVLCVAEGYATAATIHEATGYPVAVAFDAGNLKAVADVLRAKLPNAGLIFCADDDFQSEDNPGITKAREAALAVGGAIAVAVPYFGEDRPETATDFNDLARHLGPEAVKACVEAAITSAFFDYDVSGVAGVQANSDKAIDCNTTHKTGVAGVAALEHERPCFKVLDDWTELPNGGKMKPGVWFFGIKAGKDGSGPKDLTQHWICSPVHVEAVTFDGQENNFGRLLRFKNTLGRWRTWSMPMELFGGDGSDLRRELLAMGVEIDPREKNDLANYIQSQHPKRRVHCALQVGWNDGSYVLPDMVIGEKAAEVIFQTGERAHDEHTVGGTLTGWQEGIAARAVGNPLLMLAVSGSFAGPMLGRTNSEGGGFHIQGDSATGKSTLLDAACATWGGPNFKRSWRTTANGMEGAAALFNDCLLALDEISECDPREVGAIVYALGNGRGKQRASRTGLARSVTRWRCFVISNGERTIGTAMSEGGQRVKAGQSVRLLDIPAARKYGAFDDLHGEPNGAIFSDTLKLAAATHHGHAGRAFLEKLTRDPRNFGERLEVIKSLPGFSPKDGEGQEKRAAGRFALVALAGELATEYGLTGWPEGAAVEAAMTGFNLWQSLRGRGNDERRQIIEAVRCFIERNGDSRFSDADSNDENMRIIRAGWYRDDGDHRIYLFNSEGMKEATKGFELKRALDVLQEVGALEPNGTDGKRSRSLRIAGRAVRLYPIDSDRLGGDDYGA